MNESNDFSFQGAHIINAAESRKIPKRLEPAIDEVVSRIVGKMIYQTDPRLIDLILKWKAGKPVGSMQPDNFLDDPKKIQELRDVLGKDF